MHATTTLLRPARANTAGIDFVRRPGAAHRPVVVLLHGIGSNALSFLPLIDAMPAALDVVAWNAPGYAASAPLDLRQPKPADYAAALARFLDALGIERIVLCGHSLGALFAASFAAHCPSRTSAVALISPALGYRIVQGHPLPPHVQARIDDIETLDRDTFATSRAPRLVHAPERKPQIVAAVRDAMAALNPRGYIQAVWALAAGDLPADAAAIAVPTAVAVGAQDVVTPPANARIAYAALRHAAGFHEIAGAGHALPQEDPAAVAAVLTELSERINA
jgi:pimeloyl-ACP methyl ester carboxylesterase